MITALIPARGGSKGIPNKNIRLIAGRPLLHYVEDAASNSTLIDRVVVSTDSEEIKNVSTVEVVDRPPELATDTASTASVMVDFIEKYPTDVLVVIQCTSPLLEARHLDEGIRKFLTGYYDSLVSVVRQYRFVWMEKNDIALPVNHKLLYRPRRQDWNGMLVENGAFIIRDAESLLSTRSRLAGTVGLYEMPEETYLEIDSMVDFIMIERLLEAKNDTRI